MSKSAEDAITIIDQMALNGHLVHYNRGLSQQKAGFLELRINYAILAHNKWITQTVEELT